MTKKALIAEYARLVDEKFLGRLTDRKAARLERVKQEIDRLDAPRIKASDREYAEIDRRITAIEARIAGNASDSPKAKTAGSS